VTYYVKLLGASDLPMPNDWWGNRHDLEEEVRFPAPEPKEITPGDELIFYAVGGFKRIFAGARVKSRPELRELHANPVIAKRWPFAVDADLNPSARVRFVSSGPELAAVGAGLQGQIGHGVSHFEIGWPEFERAIQLLRKAHYDEEQKLKTGWRPT
jgi:hypothetical protein